jgi:hypothetical protein
MFHKGSRKRGSPKAKQLPRSPFGITANLSRSTSNMVPEAYPAKFYVDCLKYTKRENKNELLTMMSKRVFVPLQWLHYYRKFKYMQGVNARRALLLMIQIGTIHALMRGKYYFVLPDASIPGIEDQLDEDQQDEEGIEVWIMYLII